MGGGWFEVGCEEVKNKKEKNVLTVYDEYTYIYLCGAKVVQIFMCICVRIPPITTL